MKQIRFLFLILFILGVNYISSQVREIWVDRQKEAYSQLGEKCALDSAGNLYVAGYDSGYLIMKYDINKELKWKVKYRGHPESAITDILQDMVVDADGNTYLTGATGYGDNSSEYFTVKLNTDGNIIWDKRYMGSSEGKNNAFAIAVDKTGNVFVTGISKGISNNDIATIKYDNNGIQQWVRVYDSFTNKTDIGNAITLDDIGNVYIAGSAGGKYVILKYKNDGTQEWIQTYCGTNEHSNSALAITVDYKYDVYVTGSSAGNGQDIATLKLGPNGNILWKKIFNSPANSEDQGHSIAVDKNFNVYVSGYITSTETKRDFITIKYNIKGVKKWSKRYDLSGDDDIETDFALDDSGNVYLTGTSIKGTEGNKYPVFSTIKYNTNGILKWKIYFEGHEKAEALNGNNPYCILIDKFQNVYVTGHSWGKKTDQDITTVIYSQRP